MVMDECASPRQVTIPSTNKLPCCDRERQMTAVTERALEMAVALALDLLDDLDRLRQSKDLIQRAQGDLRVK